MKRYLKLMLLPLCAITLASCMTQNCTNPAKCINPPPVACKGNTTLPSSLKTLFKPTSNPALLKEAIGQPGSGGLCEGQVYEAVGSFSAYRLFNSFDAQRSKAGHWWTFEKPAGTYAKYRKDYNICPEWSPLDDIEKCEFTSGTQIVLGPGQSATCKYCLVLGVSPSQQIYLSIADFNKLTCSSEELQIITTISK
jgi:hypothetical protein